LIPNYHTIADFRKANPQALKNTFKLFVLFLKDMGLVSGHSHLWHGRYEPTIVKRTIITQKIERHLQYIEEKTNDYLKQLDVKSQ
jgi:hypothetical protein